MCKGSLCFTSLPTAVSCAFLIRQVWGVISLCFWFAFLGLAMLRIFSCACWPTVCVSLGQCLLKSSGHFFHQVSFVCWIVWTVLYIDILNIDPLSVTMFSSIFSRKCTHVWEQEGGGLAGTDRGSVSRVAPPPRGGGWGQRGQTEGQLPGRTTLGKDHAPTSAFPQGSAPALTPSPGVGPGITESRRLWGGGQHRLLLVSFSVFFVMVKYV